VVSFHPVNRRPAGRRCARIANGDATDLLGVRPYRPGDPVRDLHARSWARHGSPMVREYQESYFTRIGCRRTTDASAASPAHLEEPCRWRPASSPACVR